MEFWIRQALVWKDKCESYLSENILPLERQVWIYQNRKVIDYTYQYLYYKGIYQSQVGKIQYLSDMTEIQNFCEEKNIPLIEDACQSFGASRNGQQAGTFGDIATFLVNLAIEAAVVSLKKKLGEFDGN